MSNSSGGNITIPELVWTSAKTVQASIFGAIVVSTVIGNFLALYAFVTNKRDLRSPTHFFLANLALADLFVGALTLPFLATYSVTLRWYFGQQFCFIWSILHFWFCSSSILSTLAICIERFIGVKYPLKHLRKMNKRVVGVMIVSVWILAAILSAIPLFVWPEAPSEKPYDCKINLQLGHVIVASVGIFHLPATVMVILYWQIYREATRIPDDLKHGVKSTGGTIRPRSTTTTLNLNSKMDSPSRQIRLAKKLSFLVGFLIISYLPMFTVFLVLGFKPDFCPLEIFILLAWLRYLNSSVNPIIYAFSVPGYKNAFKSIFASCCCCLKQKRILSAQNTQSSQSSSTLNLHKVTRPSSISSTSSTPKTIVL